MINKIRTFLSNLTLSNAIHFVVGHYKRFIYDEFARMYEQDDVEKLLNKAASCPECVNNGFCVNSDCECPIVEVMLSDKPCPNGRF